MLAQSLFEAHLTGNDLDRAMKFYREVVGLEFATRFANRSNRLETGLYFRDPDGNLLELSSIRRGERARKPQN
jgi:catechol-2,3-dioxygenase